MKTTDFINKKPKVQTPVEQPVVEAQSLTFPEFTMESAEQLYKTLSEDASAGATGSPSVAISTSTLGEKGSFSQKDMKKKINGYTNVLTRGGPVKLGKQ